MIIKSIPGSIVAPSPIMNKNTVIETFPTAIVCGLFPEIYPVKYKIKPKVPYKLTQQNMATLLNRFKKIEEKDKTINGIIKSEIMAIEINKKNHKHIEDQADAFLCAYGLYCIYKGQASALTYGCIHDGFITVPEVKK
jgi:predicted RNase H-like nuclease